MTGPGAVRVTKVSAAAEAMHARVVAVSRFSAHLDMTEAQAVQVSGLMRGITEQIRLGKSMIVMAGDDGEMALYPSEAMITAMDELEVALRGGPDAAVKVIL